MSATLQGTVEEAGLSKGPYRAPRGTEISCKGWQQEAALRMLLNNLDPEVAEKPQDLVVIAERVVGVRLCDPRGE